MRTTKHLDEVISENIREVRELDAENASIEDESITPRVAEIERERKVAIRNIQSAMFELYETKEALEASLED